MLCVNCGKENADNFRFCQFCGTPMKAEQRSRTEIDPVSLPPSTVTTPNTSIDDWLTGNNIHAASLSAPSIEGLETATATNFNDLDLSVLDDLPTIGKPVCEETSGRTCPSMPNKMSTQVNERICQTCGDIVSDGHRFCGNCGARFESQVHMEAITRDTMLDNNTKRSIERVSFVQKRASIGPDYAMFSLFHVNDDGTAGEAITLYEGENIIGRTSSCLLSTDRFVNPKHVRILCEQNYAIIEDCDSLNGVFLRISDEAITLFDGDIFRIGEELMSYHHGNSDQIILKNRTTERTAFIGGDEFPGWGYLRLIVGAYSEGNVYRLSEPSVSIGRTHGDILFPKDGFVSGLHATLSCDGDTALLTDLNSSNGTFVRLKTSLRLDDTTYFLIGNQLMCIQPKAL